MILHPKCLVVYHSTKNFDYSIYINVCCSDKFECKRNSKLNFHERCLQEFFDLLTIFIRSGSANV